QLAGLHARRQTLGELAAQPGIEDGAAALLADPRLSPALHRAAEVSFPPELRGAFTRLLAQAGTALSGPAELRGQAAEVLADRAADALWLDAAPAPELHQQSLWRQLDCAPELLGGLVALLGDVLLAGDMAEAQVLLM